MESLDVSTRDRGILWRGQTSYIRRMVEGVDWDGLEGAGVTFPDEVRHDLDRQQSVIMRPITMQDALDAAIFIVRTTIEMERLTDGTYAKLRDAIPRLWRGCSSPRSDAVVYRVDSQTRSGTQRAWPRRGRLTVAGTNAGAQVRACDWSKRIALDVLVGRILPVLPNGSGSSAGRCTASAGLF